MLLNASSFWSPGKGEGRRAHARQSQHHPLHPLEPRTPRLGPHLRRRSIVALAPTCAEGQSLSLELKPNVLTQGALYKFRLYARRAAAAGAAVSSLQSALTEGGYAEVVVECNAAPSGGRVLVDSFAGQALISNFTLTAAGTSTCACMTRTRTQACPLKDTYVSTCVHVCSQRVI